MPPTMSNIPNTRFQTSIFILYIKLSEIPDGADLQSLPTANCDCKLKNYFVTYTQPTNGSGNPGSLSSIT